MKNVSISLTDQHAEAIEAQIAMGDYASVSEVIRAALRGFFNDNPAGVSQAQMDRDIEEYMAERDDPSKFMTLEEAKAILDERRGTWNRES